MITKDMNEEMLLFQVDGKTYPVKIRDIVCIIREKTTIKVLMSDAAVLELKYTSLAKILRKVQSDRLELCNRSAIVNRDYIYAVDPANHYITLRNIRGGLDLGFSFKEKIMAGLANKEDEILLRMDNIRYIVRVDEFLYAKSSDRVLHIFLQDGKEFRIPQKPIEFILQQVRTDKLVRCSRGVLVNRECVEEIDKKERKMLLVNGEQMKIGSQYLTMLCERA